MRNRPISPEEFYQVCEHIKTHRDHYLSTRPSPKKFASEVSEKVGFAVPSVTANRARSAVDVRWTTASSSQDRAKLARDARAQHRAHRRLTTAIAAAYLEDCRLEQKTPSMEVVEAADAFRKSQEE